MKMQKQLYKIEETEHVVDDHFFDVVGNEFKDHVKGLAEWLKNSVDAYIDKGMLFSEQVVILRFTDEEVSKATIECIDFVGMDKIDIEKAFKRWGDPNAAKRGKNIKVYGGHGNGGKFYMRQAFTESQFVTYKNGFLNVFGFSKNKKYGYAKGFQNKKMSAVAALEFAQIDSLPIPEALKKKVINGTTGFTVVMGIDPVGMRKKLKPTREMEKLKNYPQSRRILQQINVAVVYNGHSLYGLLKPEELEPLEKFENPRTIHIPETLDTGVGSEKIRIELTDEKYSQGSLILKTSAEAMTKGGKMGELNRIDVLGEVGVIASYQLYELGVKGWPQAAFIYGECQLPILEKPENDCVANDRAKLVKNETTNVLIDWIAQEIDKMAKEIATVEREKQKASQKEISSKFNDVLNQWKNKHMKKIMSELFSGGGGASPDDNSDGTMGTEVTLPSNGFSFKNPEVEIPALINSKVTLKVSVPDALPLGAIIFITSNNKTATLENEKYYVKSDYLKSTKNGQEVAFIHIGLVGLKANSESIIKASAGKLVSSIKVKFIEAKEGKSGKSFPRVLLSSFDSDPLNIAPEGILHLSERESVVYQRPQDVDSSIYWINTSSPMASKLYDHFTFESLQWRNFLFERYVDIFVKEAIHELEKKDYENFTADAVDQKISDTVKKVHQSAKDDLDQFLFDESYSLSQQNK